VIGRRTRIAAYTILAAGFGWLFYVRYWKWRDCIQEALSSCVTPDGDNLIAAGMLWGLVALGWFAAVIYAALKR
jgi:hypothetical protein